MLRLLLASVFLASTSGALGQSPEAARGIRVTPLSPEQFASVGFTATDSAGLFVGVRSFVDFDGKTSSRVAEIPYAVDDAIDLAHLFSLELRLIAPHRVTLALSGKPQKPRTQEALRKLVEAGARETNARFTTLLTLIDHTKALAGQNGLALMTFATHGYTSDGVFRLLGEDSSPSALDLTGLPVERITDLAASSSAQRRVLLIDACRERIASARAAASDPGTALSEDFTRALRAATGTAVLCASTAGGYSYDDPIGKNGVFSAAVIAGLRGAARSDPRGFVTPATLAQYVDGEVRRWVSENRPEHTEVSRGISYTTDDLRSGGLPLAYHPGALAKLERASLRRDRLLAVVRSHAGGQHLTEAVANEVAAALHEQEEGVIAPLLERLDNLEVLGSNYAEDFAFWWTERGRDELKTHSVRARKDAVPNRPLLRLTTDSGRTTFEEGESIRVQLVTSHPGHATVVLLDAEGTAALLFPNHFRLDSRVRARESTVFNLRAAPPHGVTRILAWWTSTPLRIEGVDEKEIRRHRGAVPLAAGLKTTVTLPGAEEAESVALEEFGRNLAPAAGVREELRITTTKKVSTAR